MCKFKYMYACVYNSALQLKIVLGIAHTALYIGGAVLQMLMQIDT